VFCVLISHQRATVIIKSEGNAQFEQFFYLIARYGTSCEQSKFVGVKVFAEFNRHSIFEIQTYKCPVEQIIQKNFGMSFCGKVGFDPLRLL